MNICEALSKCRSWQRVTNGVDVVYLDDDMEDVDTSGDWWIDEDYCDDDKRENARQINSELYWAGRDM